jgi:hypothetical protein
VGIIWNFNTAYGSGSFLDGLLCVLDLEEVAIGREHGQSTVVFTHTHPRSLAIWLDGLIRFVQFCYTQQACACTWGARLAREALVGVASYLARWASSKIRSELNSKHRTDKTKWRQLEARGDDLRQWKGLITASFLM